jgi:hypothetical protein
MDKQLFGTFRCVVVELRVPRQRKLGCERGAQGGKERATLKGGMALACLLILFKLNSHDTPLNPSIPLYRCNSTSPTNIMHHRIVPGTFSNNCYKSLSLALLLLHSHDMLSLRIAINHRSHASWSDSSCPCNGPFRRGTVWFWHLLTQETEIRPALRFPS